MVRCSGNPSYVRALLCADSLFFPLCALRQLFYLFCICITMKRQKILVQGRRPKRLIGCWGYFGRVHKLGTVQRHASISNQEKMKQMRYRLYSLWICEYTHIRTVWKTDVEKLFVPYLHSFISYGSFPSWFPGCIWNDSGMPVLLAERNPTKVVKSVSFGLNIFVQFAFLIDFNVKTAHWV